MMFQTSYRFPSTLPNIGTFAMRPCNSFDNSIFYLIIIYSLTVQRYSIIPTYPVCSFFLPFESSLDFTRRNDLFVFRHGRILKSRMRESSIDTFRTNPCLLAQII
jgi:hypothetical protein